MNIQEQANKYLVERRKVVSEVDKRLVGVMSAAGGIGGAVGGAGSYFGYDKNLAKLKQRAKTETNPRRLANIKKMIHDMERLGKKKFALKMAGAGGLGGAIGGAVGGYAGQKMAR